MLLGIFVTSDDDIHNRLLHFSTAIDGAYFFVPSEEVVWAGYEKVISTKRRFKNLLFTIPD